MKTVNITLYTFDDLSEDVQKEIIESERWNIMDACMDAYGTDYRASLKEFEELINVRCTSWSVNYCTFFYRFQVHKEEAFEWRRTDNSDYDYIKLSSLKGKLLMRYLQSYILPYIIKGKYFGKLVGTYPNAKHFKRYSKVLRECSCPMTGAIYDHYLLDPILQYIQKPDESMTYRHLIDMCLHSFFDTWHKEYEYWGDDENAIREELHNNHYEDRLYYKDGTVSNIPVSECA